MRCILLTLFFSALALAAHATVGSIRPQTLRARPTSAPPPSLRPAADTLPADTVPALTRAELRELRQLERAEARARRRGIQAPLDASAASAGAKRRNGLAVASLATGIAGILLVAPVFLVADAGIFVFFAAAFACALVFGAIALRRANRKGRRHRGLAIAGFILGIIGSAYSALLLLALATSTAG